MNGIKKIDKEYYLILSLFALSFIIRMLFSSHYLDDWDSIQFALGIHEFNIAVHQPHPPGYPAYIFLADIFYIFLQNDTFTLTYMSVLFGSLSVVFTYLLGKVLFDYKVGILSAVLIAFTPAHLVFSLVAMNDIVFLCFMTASIYLLYAGLKNDKYLLFGSGLTGLTIGFRPQNFLMMICINLLFLFWRKDVKLTLTSLLTVAFGGLLWFVPVSYLSGGPIRYIELTRSQIDALDRFNFTFAQSRALVYLMIEGWTIVLLIFLILAIAGLLLKVKNGGLKLINVNNKPLILLTVWLLLSTITSISLYLLYITRYLLPAFVPVAIIISYSIINLNNISSKKYIKAIIYGIVCLAIMAMGMQALSMAFAISDSQPAPVQAAIFIEDNYDHNNTMIVAQDSYRHFQYYLPDYCVSYNNLYSNEMLKKSIVLTENSVTLGQDKKIAEFRRSRDVYPKHERVVLFENNIYDTFLFVSGYYNIEYLDDTPTRWTTNQTTIVYYSREDVDRTIYIRLKSFNEPRNVSLYLNDELVYQKEVAVTFEDIRIPVRLAGGMNKIRIYSGAWNARPVDMGINADSKPLSFAIQNLSTE